MSLCPTFDKRLIECPTNISCIYKKWNVNSFACLYHKTHKFIIIIIIITATTTIIVIKVFKVSTHLILVLEPRVLLKKVFDSSLACQAFNPLSSVGKGCCQKSTNFFEIWLSCPHFLFQQFLFGPLFVSSGSQPVFCYNRLFSTASTQWPERSVISGFLNVYTQETLYASAWP